MKRILLLTFVIGLVFSGFAQRPTVSKDLRNFAVKMVQPTAETMNFSQESLPVTKADWPPEENIIGTTYYDLQTNSSMQNRMFVYDDGTIGCVFTFGNDFATFPDRGTGYNYYDGSTWGSAPEERTEDDRTGWPAYGAWGEGGEINVAHYSGASTEGLAITRRDTKGTGDWTQVDFHAPASDAEYLWPRMATGGVNHSVLHVLSITMPTPNGGNVYQGMDGAILYSRSEDGGDTWSVNGELFPEMSSTNYFGFSGDTYEIISEGDNVAFVYGGEWTDMGLMKSTDGGTTWDQTVIWENPYPFFDFVTTTPAITDTFYCPDASHSLAFDQSGKVHVVFGINRAHSDGTGKFWFPGVDGIGYWNEDRPTFSNSMDALCPLYSDCVNSELVEDYSLIGWMQDLNGNDSIDLTADIAPYYLGASSMPQILIDENNYIYVVYSSLTEGYENSGTPNYNYRHLWSRTSVDLGENWGEFYDLTSELIHIFDECVFPSIATNSDESFYLVYQTDNEPGMAVRPDPGTHAYNENSIRVMEVLKDDLIDGIGENNLPIYDYDVSQNFPNPFTGSSIVNVNVRQASELSLEVVNMMGQVVYTIDAGVASVGVKALTIDGSKLTTGVYFYTVRAGETSITKKMIVE